MSTIELNKPNWSIQWCGPDPKYPEGHWYVHVLVSLDPVIEGEGEGTSTETAMAEALRSVIESAEEAL